MRSKNIILFVLVFVLILYAFTAASQPDTLRLLISGAISPDAAMMLFFRLPFLFLTNIPLIQAILFGATLILSTSYIYLLASRIAQRRSYLLSYGLSGGMLSIVSIGCVACGALLSPLMFVAGFGIPLSFLSSGRLNIFLGVLANILLSIGVIALYRDKVK